MEPGAARGLWDRQIGLEHLPLSSERSLWYALLIVLGILRATVSGPLFRRFLTADFSVVEPYRMMRTDSSAEKSSRPIVHDWRARVNINATRC
jgi:hypothetical protein